jgi:hypothetical protein
VSRGQIVYRPFKFRRLEYVMSRRVYKAEGFQLLNPIIDLSPKQNMNANFDLHAE